VDGGPTKSGVTPGEALALAQAVSQLPRLQLRGVMSIPEPAPDFASAVAVHQRTRAVLEALRAEWGEAGAQLDTLSMGMSSDLEAAIHAGSTLVRVGTAIFGGRGHPASAG
jgi:PLP dependent protein